MMVYNLRLFSDHIIHGFLKLFTMLAILINGVFIHGYSPGELLTSIVIPIPKNNGASLKCSDNYRGIALRNSICKLIDLVLIDRFSHVLYTSNLQFGFTKNHSSVIRSRRQPITLQPVILMSTHAYWMPVRPLIVFISISFLCYCWNGTCQQLLPDICWIVIHGKLLLYNGLDVAPCHLT